MKKKVDAPSNLDDIINSCREQLHHINTVVHLLGKKIDELENHSPRSNLIIHGLNETQGENTETLETALKKNIFQDILELHDIPIERIHRLGKPVSEQKRPVILRLLNSRDKSVILKKGYKLKNTHISIGEDVSRRVREVRRKLWASARTNRDKQEKVTLSFDKMYIANVGYVWDEEKNEKCLFEKKTEP